MNSIQDYYQISDLLATSGQPTAQQFLLIAQAGYHAVINLAMSSSTNTYYFRQINVVYPIKNCCKQIAYCFTDMKIVFIA